MNKLQLLLIMDQVNAKLVLLGMMHQDVTSLQLLEGSKTQVLRLVWTTKRPMLVMKPKPREAFST